MKTKLLFFFLFSLNISFTQEIETKLISTTPLQADTFIGIDDFENIYFLKNNILYKKRANDTINYSNVLLGKINSVNIQNPFKIVIFYRDFNSITLLDNNLNELTNRIDLTRETLFNNVQLVSISSENDLWLYADDTKLHLYDYKNHSVKTQTQPMNFYQKGFVPNLMKSTYKNVWMVSENGIMQFNEYGNYIQFHKINNISAFFPSKNKFAYFKNGDLFLFENNRSVPIQLNYKNNIKNIYINKTNIYIYDGSKIYKYRFL